MTRVLSHIHCIINVRRAASALYLPVPGPTLLVLHASTAPRRRMLAPLILPALVLLLEPCVIFAHPSQQILLALPAPLLLRFTLYCPLLLSLHLLHTALPFLQLRLRVRPKVPGGVQRVLVVNAHDQNALGQIPVRRDHRLSTLYGRGPPACPACRSLLV
jgi:hypothetical protein